MKLRSATTPNAILHIPNIPPKEVDSSPPQLPPLFFFVTGNPGLVSYYKEYLGLLSGDISQEPAKSSPSDGGKDDDTKNQSSQQHDTSIHTEQDRPSVSDEERRNKSRLTTEDCVIAAFSLGGFEIENEVDTTKLSASLSSTRTTTTNPRGTPSSTSDTTRDENGDGNDDNHDNDKYIQSLLYPPSYPRKQIYGLHDQIELCYARLQNLCRLMFEHYGYDSKTGAEIGIENENKITEKDPSIKVILTGHSVGTYIALEMTRLHYENQQRHARSESKSLNTTSAAINFQIISAHLLTPTIIDLAKSPSGLAAQPILSNIPLFPTMAQFFSNRLVHTFFSRSYVEWMINKVTGMEIDSPGLQTTKAFLMSKKGVTQALYLAREELRDMRENKWGAEVWGVERKGDGIDENDGDMEASRSKDMDATIDLRDLEHQQQKWQAPRLFLLFAAWDGYISEATRNKILDTLEENQKLIEEDINKLKRYKASHHPVVIIDEEGGMVHAWCLKHSDKVARISRGWVEDVLNT